MSNTAFIYDAVRTPRSKGKPSGTLHEVKPIDLGAGLLNALQERNDLDTSYVDDVVMGCVSPIGEQGSDIAKMIVQNAGWDESVAGVQLNRFCASGLEAVNTGAQKVASGWENLVPSRGHTFCSLVFSLNLNARLTSLSILLVPLYCHAIKNWKSPSMVSHIEKMVFVSDSTKPRL